MARLGEGMLRAAVALDPADTATARQAFALDLLSYLAVIAAFLLAAAYPQVAVGLQPHDGFETVRQTLDGVIDSRSWNKGAAPR